MNVCISLFSNIYDAGWEVYKYFNQKKKVSKDIFNENR